MHFWHFQQNVLLLTVLYLRTVLNVNKSINFLYPYSLYPTIPTFNARKKKTIENTVGKGENAGNGHFLLFSQCFLLYQKREIFILSSSNSPNALNLAMSEILLFGNGPLYPMLVVSIFT